MTIYISTIIDALYQLSRRIYGSRGKHLTALLQSYHAHRSDVEGEVYVTSDSTASRIVTQLPHQLPKPMHQYYASEHPEHLRTDIAHYIDMTVVSAKQYHMHYDCICGIINQADNIDAQDKRYILEGNASDRGTDLADIVYRAMWVLLHDA